MKYRNNSASDLWLPGVGDVKAGATIEIDTPLNNANFSLIEERAQPTPKPQKGTEPNSQESKTE